MVSFIIPFLSSVVFANCEIPQPRFSTMACPVTPDHVSMIHDFYGCLQKKQSAKRRKARTGKVTDSLDRNCSSHVQTSHSSSGNPLLFMLPAARVLKMSPAERAGAINQFFDQKGKAISNEIAAQNFTRDLRRPPEFPSWGGREKPSPQFLQREYQRLEALARSKPKERGKFREFQRSFQHYITAANQNGGHWTKIHEPLSVEVTIKGRGTQTMDIANTPFDELPENATYRLASGQSVPLKEPYLKVGQSHVHSARQHLLNGGSLKDLQVRSSDVNKAEFQRLMRKAGADYRTRMASNSKLTRGKNGRIRTSDSGKKSALSKTLRRIPWGGGFISVGSLVVSGAMLHVAREKECDKAFPFYPTSRVKSHVTGMPLSSKCQMEIPVSGKMPKEIREFSGLSYADQDELLNLTSSNRSPCGYYRQAYNKIFCSQNSANDTGDSSEVSH